MYPHKSAYENRTFQFSTVNTWSWIAESYKGIWFTLLEMDKFFHSGCTILHFQEQSMTELLCILTSTWYCQLRKANLVYVHVIIVLICISLMTDDVEHLFCSYLSAMYFLFLIYLVFLGLRCCAQAFSSREWGLLFVVVRGLLIVVVSLVAEHRL